MTRHGKVVWYVRIGGAKGPRRRLRAPFGSSEFDAEYRAAIAEEPPGRAKGPENGTLAWLIARYRDSSAWTGLALATRKMREAILRQVIANAGDKPFSQVTEASIAAGRDRRAATPFQARHFLDTMRGLFA